MSEIDDLITTQEYKLGLVFIYGVIFGSFVTALSIAVMLAVMGK